MKEEESDADAEDEDLEEGEEGGMWWSGANNGVVQLGVPQVVNKPQYKNGRRLLNGEGEMTLILLLLLLL